MVEGLGDEAAAPPSVKVDKPLPGKTDKGVVEVKGSVTGEGVRYVLLTVGETSTKVLARGGSFKASATLREGENVLTARVEDAYGQRARDRVVVDYVPAREGPAVSLDAPAPGTVIDALEQPYVVVSGTAGGRGVDAVRVYLNGSPYTMAVRGGRFGGRLPVQAEDNTLYAEAEDALGRTSRSAAVRFRAVDVSPMDLVVRVSFSGGGARPVLRCRRAPRPSAVPGRDAPPGFKVDEDEGVSVASVGRGASGIYTVGVYYDTGAGGPVSATFDVTLYGYDPARKKTRETGPLRLSGRGWLPAVRVLMPEGVFWEDDSWFSGIIEGNGYTIKYKGPEGISWREEDR